MKIRVAIADDHPEIRSALKLVLNQDRLISFQFEAINGKDLLLQLTNTPVDLVLLDIRMPEMDGMETLKILRRVFPEVKVIMFSSSTEDNIVEQAKSLGASSFLAKSESFKLIETIHEVFNNEV